MTVAIGVILPTSTPDPEHPILGDVRASARLAEALGLESVWTSDHLIASAPILDSTVTVATAAAVTDRIRVGFNVMLLALRPVAWAAKQIAALQHVSGNRIVLGVGTGNPAHGDIGWRAAGVAFDGRGARTDEALAVLPDLVTGKPATLSDGLEVTLSPGAELPPILVAGNGDRARRRAAAHADGWIVLRPEPGEIPAARAHLRELAERYGRPVPAITVVAPELPTDVTAAADRLAEYAAAGVERVVLAPSGPDWERDYTFAAELVRR
ncbi:LLM class flavin-dependent oxidoreductase [Nocardia bovistercoris]|uniref:LLM class flavin-dependent oxidoreductase n=1 Tax=Nocardia bovistercoris TaxID=2785916 RepID=A0A931N2A3_9NOCA|nr:LLM class flavin-dependent oxidoreductase [Nocardia bovistercoris]MBH0779285.1 LLM class flavin-dependent oxidoreductase [Nocardia bovistercoris]